jgi:hypothetical protein
MSSLLPLPWRSADAFGGIAGKKTKNHARGPTVDGIRDSKGVTKESKFSL